MAFLAPLLALIPTLGGAGAAAAGGAAATMAATMPMIGAVTLSSTLPALGGAAAAGGISAMSAITLGTTLASAAVAGIGAVQSAQARSSADKYNAKIQAQNAQVAQQNATLAGQAGMQQAGMQGLKTKGQAGAISAMQGASNIDPNTGSARDTSLSAKALGELDALTIRSNATKEAYGHEVQGVNFMAQSNLDRFSASNDLTAGYIGGAGTILGGVSSAADMFQRYQMSGAITG